MYYDIISNIIFAAMQKLFDSKKELYSFVQSVVEDANIIYKKQLNIKLMVGDIVLADGQKWDTCGYKLSDKLMLLSQWKKPSFQGMWHLFGMFLDASDFNKLL